MVHEYQADLVPVFHHCRMGLNPIPAREKVLIYLNTDID